MRVLGRLVLLLGLALLACASDDSEPCNRDGCNALHQRAKDNGRTGVSGFVAEESDVIDNGCAECPFATGNVDFWLTTDSAGSTPPKMPTEPPTGSVFANGQYFMELEAGSYVACIRSDCTTVTVSSGHVTTLNIKLIFGPTQFYAQ